MPENADVIVLGLSPTGLYAVREAARKGYSVLGVGASGAPGLWSRFLVDRVVANTPEERVSAILERTKTNSGNKPLLIVTSDQDLEAIFTKADILCNQVQLQKSYLDGLAKEILDKERFYSFCDTHAVPYPSLQSATIDEVDKYRDLIAYPLMIKPARIQDVKHLMAGQKGWIVKSKSDFVNVLPRIPREAGTLLMQEIVPGPESNIMLWCGYLDESGTVRQRFTAQKLRQYPAGFGSASLVQSKFCADTAQAAEDLLSKLGFRGIAAAEFKRHPETGELKVIEVNPRPSLWLSVATAAGVPLIETAIAEANGLNLPKETHQKDGVLWRYAAKDFASQLFYQFHRDFVLPPPDLGEKMPVTGRADVTFAWDDPMPSVADALSFIRKRARRMASNRGRHK